MSLPKTNPTNSKEFADLEPTYDENRESSIVVESTIDNPELTQTEQPSEATGIKKLWWIIPILGLFLAISGVSVTALIVIPCLYLQFIPKTEILDSELA